MELLQLRYFFESANLESFAKTAEKYMVPASSVSASVKRLEAELGCRLFDRTSNRIVLNENGKRMMDSLKVIFDELDRMSGGLTDQRNPYFGKGTENHSYRSGDPVQGGASEYQI